MGRFSGILQGVSPVRLARKAIRRPGAALTALTRLAQANWETLAFEDAAAWDASRRELAETGLLERLQGELRSAFAAIAGQTVRGRSVVAGGVRPLHAEMLWALVRLRKPAVVVETGVCNGLSSAVILEAMHANGAGRLISIDLPEFSDAGLDSSQVWEGKGGAVIPAGRAVGWLAPEVRRDRWTLLQGRAQELLAPALAETGPVDIFIHDSEHSFANQLFEFTAGYDALHPGGLLVATDINWSRAFDQFWRGVRGSGAKRAYVDHSCALVAKP